jgi:ubiquinone/menaquinone biosynthesis C-methylase UbiE
MCGSESFARVPSAERSTTGIRSEPVRLDYDELASEYAAHRTVHPAVLRHLVATGEIAADSRVLEVGCGTGNYAGALAQATGCRCRGIDPSAEMLSRGRQTHPALELRRGEAGHLEFESGSLDLVFSVDVIHHVRDRSRAFQEAFRVLGAGGRICTVTDSEWIIRNRQPLAVCFPETVAVDLARYPATDELRMLMEQAGFDAICEEQAQYSYVTSDLEPYRARAFSSLHLISETAFRQGLTRLEETAKGGGVPCVSRYVLLWGTRRIGNG